MTAETAEVLKGLKALPKEERNKKIKKILIQREIDRREQAVRSQAAHEQRVESTTGFVKMAAHSIPQAASMGFLDDAISAVSPDLGKSFKKGLSEGREEWPTGSTLLEVATPTPLGYLGKVGKLSKAASKISPMLGKGTEIAGKVGGMVDDYIPANTLKKAVVEGGVTAAGEAKSGDRLLPATVAAGATAVMGGAGKLAGKLISDPHRILGKKIGLRPKDLKQHVADLEDPDIYLEGMTRSFRKRNLYKGVGGKFNTETGKFEGMTDNLSSPDVKGMMGRFRDMRDKSNTKIEGIINRKSDDFPLHAQPERGTFDADSFKAHKDNTLKELEAKLHNKYPAKKEEIGKLVSDELTYIAKGDEKVFTVRDLHDRKKSIYNEIAKSYDANATAMDSYKKDALKGLAKIYKETVEELVPETTKHNVALKEVFDVQSALGAKVREEIFGSTSAGSGSMSTKALEGLQALSDPTAKTRANIGLLKDAIEGKLPSAVKDRLQTAGAKVVPHVFTRDNNRSPDSIEEDLTRIRFPRDTQYILDNRDAFLEKVKVMEPEAFETIHTMIEYGDRSDAEIVLPQLTKKYPHLFEPDSLGLNMFDGKVPPESKSKAAEYIFSQNMSNTEKISRIDKLNRTGAME